MQSVRRYWGIKTSVALRTKASQKLHHIIVLLIAALLSHGQIHGAITPEKGSYFVENKGQVHDSKALYLAEVGNNALLFYQDGLSYIKRERNGKGQLLQHRVDLKFLGALPETEVTGCNPLPSYSNYHSTAKGGDIRAKHFETLVYKNVYPHIDLKYFFPSDGSIKYEFIVHPSGQVEDIQIAYSGMAKDLRLTEDGSLEIETVLGNIQEAAPYTFQQEGNEIASSYQLNKNRLTFKVGAYDGSKDLIIDPHLEWSTYLGGGAGDAGLAIEQDATFHLYVLGTTMSQNFPGTAGAHQDSLNGAIDLFVSKFDSLGQLLWSTYLGGMQHESGGDLAVSQAGDVYVVGNTRSKDSLSIATNAFQKDLAGGTDAFLTKLNSQGQWQWATYLGGSDDEAATSIEISPSGTSVYVSGHTNSKDFHTSTTAYQSTLKDSVDGFITQFNSNGTVGWSTFIGGSGQDIILDTYVDQIGNLYATGTTSSTDFPMEGNNLQDTLIGKFDALIVKLLPNGTPLWSTYYGGSEIENGAGITVSDSFNVFITGTTRSKDLYIENPSDTLQDTFAGGLSDIYILAMGRNGRLVWATYYGGDSTDEAASIDWFDRAIAVSGRSNSSGLRLFTYGENSLRYRKGNGFDGFMINLDTSSSPINSTYIGGNGDDSIAKAIFYFGGQALTGSTHSTDYDTLAPLQKTNAGTRDAVVTTLCPDLYKIISSGCRHDGNTGITFADSMEGNYSIRYYWQVKSEFNQWRNIVNSNRITLPNRTFVQDMFYRRIYTAGMCTDTSFTSKYIFDATPVARFTLEKDTFCSSDTLFPDNLTTILYGNFSSHWNFKRTGGPSGFEPAIPAAWAIDTNTRVHLTTISDSGCVSTYRQKIHIKEQPTAQFITEQNCKDFSVRYRDTFSIKGRHKVRWDFGDGSTANQRFDLRHDYGKPGTFDVTLHAAYGADCADSFTRSITVDSLVEAGFSAANSCVRDSVSFQNTSSFPKGSISYQWDFGDSSALVGASNPKHLYTKNGSYTARLLLTHGNGCQDSLSREVKIIAPPDISPIAEKACNADSFLFQIKPTEIHQSYRFSWQLGDGTEVKDSLRFRHKYDSIQLYNTLLISSIDSVSCRDSIFIDLQNTAPFSAHFMAASLCFGDTTQFTDSTDYTGLYSFRRWYFGDGDSSDSKNPGHAYQAGLYQVRLVLESDSGCRDTAVQEIDISGKPIAGFLMGTACLGDSIGIQNTSTAVGDSIVTWTWDLGNSTTSTEKEPVLSFDAEGFYMIQLIAETAKGCKDTFLRRYEQYALPAATLLNIKDVDCAGGSDGAIQTVFTDGQGAITGTWSTSPPRQGSSIQNLKPGSYTVVLEDAEGCTTQSTFEVGEPDSVRLGQIADAVICEKEATDFFAFASGGTAPYKYEWTCSRRKCHIGINNGNKITAYPRYNTTYTVVATDTLDCKSSPRNFDVFVLRRLTVDAGPDLNGIGGREIQLNAEADTAADYQWTPASPLDDPDIKDPIAVLNSTTTFTVTVSSPNTCPAEDEVTVNIVQPPRFANSFTPNGDGVNDTWEIRNTEAFPDLAVSIYNRWGALLFSSVGYDIPWDGSFNGQQMPSGSYYYVIELGNGIEPYKGDLTILK